MIQWAACWKPPPPPKGVESFRFDPAGNLLDNASAADGHQDDSLMSNLLSQYAGRHYRYDSRGNLVEKCVNALTRAVKKT
ncbi:hypothetical protein [Chromobacterium violaceum]|uniref:hypothetical protein n=1 Tax=Chromobacterium violaceum TaxID=536 RepID=UPI0005D3390A|nr:hypothetical protein [Chromobacterium violaceum]KJH65448.1 hypothetical protein UF16_21660 [Chromobacterium violaceum]